MLTMVSPFVIDGTAQMIEHDAGFRRARLVDRLADVVGDVTDLHAPLDVGAALHQRIEDAGLARS